MSNIIKTNVFFLIGSSSSMECIKKETLKHFNEQIKIIKKSQKNNMETFVSVFTFNEKNKEIMFQKPISEVQDLSEKDYENKGMTSVFDAINSAIDKAELINDNESSFLFCILSDASDNSSSESIASVSKRIEYLQSTGSWTFTFIGANQDIDKSSVKLKIPRGNLLKYDSHSLGVNTMTETQKKSIGYFFTARSYGTTSTRGFYGTIK